MHILAPFGASLKTCAKQGQTVKLTNNLPREGYNTNER